MTDPAEDHAAPSAASALSTGAPAATKPAPAKLAVLGAPIAHSRSPRLHRAAYEMLGLPWEYAAIECDETSLATWLAARDAAWRGLSLTMPLKAEAHRLAVVRDPVASESGVVNTLLQLIGGTWAGFNTDVGGLAAALDEAGLDARNTVVLGSGATAVSAVLAARRCGAQLIRVLARNTRAASDIVHRFGGTAEPDAGAVTLEGWGIGTGPTQGGPISLAYALENDPSLCEASLVISTLPGPASVDLAVPPELAAVPLFDVAYDPWPSPLATAWHATGGEAHSGLGMLLHQALLQVRIFVGGDPGVALDREAEVLAAMRDAVVGE